MVPGPVSDALCNDWWWISFSVDGRNAGVVVANFPGDCSDKNDVAGLTKELWRRGCNPGGSVRLVSFDPRDLSDDEWRPVASLPQWTLLSQEQLADAGVRVNKT